MSLLGSVWMVLWCHQCYFPTILCSVPNWRSLTLHIYLRAKLQSDWLIFPGVINLLGFSLDSGMMPSMLYPYYTLFSTKLAVPFTLQIYSWANPWAFSASVCHTQLTCPQKNCQMHTFTPRDYLRVWMDIEPHGFGSESPACPSVTMHFLPLFRE